MGVYRGLIPTPISEFDSPPYLIASVSDLHSGSKVALCDNAGIELDEGGHYQPSYLQTVLWGWWLEYWGAVEAVRDYYQAKLIGVLNGDVCDGFHTRNSQLIAKSRRVQTRVAMKSLAVPISMGVDKWAVVRGTPVHSGVASDLEEDIAERLNAVRAPDGFRTHWGYNMSVYGYRIEFRHHGKAGRIHRTRGSAVNLLAEDIWANHVDREEEPPHLAVRSHVHTMADSGPNNYQTRAITLPPWSLKNDHAEKVAADATLRIGGLMVLVTPDGKADIELKHFTVKGPKVWNETISEQTSHS